MLFKGMTKRIEKEVGLVAPPTMKVNIVQAQRDLVWIGGSILASLSTFKDMFIDKSEYDEVGPAIVHKKCF